MGLFDAPMATLNQTLVNVLGGSATLKSVTVGYDPQTDQKTLLPNVTYPVKVSAPYPFSVDDISNTTIQANDFQLLLPTLQFASFNPVPIPTVGWSIIKSGIEYEIVSIIPLNTGDAVAAYILHCRG